MLCLDSCEEANMGTQLLDIQPRELKFVFELKKQSSCTIRLVNKSHNHVAFKVKTTSPKKYCVRPNVGIVMPKSTCEFTVTMQAQRSAPPDMLCKDKFLVQSTIVPADTSDEDITPIMFSKEEGKHIEENKLKVSLISPTHSPVLSPINGSLKQGIDEAPALKDPGLAEVDFLLPEPMVREQNFVAKAIDSIKVVKNEESPPAKIAEVKLEENNLPKVVKDVGLEAYAKDVQSCTKDDVEGANLVNDVKEMKFKLSELESKLSESEVTISKLTEERRLSTQERQILIKELALLSSRKGTRTVHDGFPLLFVVMVALVSLTFGYLLH